jgi:integrase
MLTDRTIRGLKPRSRSFEVADGKVQGLSLRVLPGGAKRWSYRYRVGRGWRRISLGPFPSISLADARELAEEKLREVKKGGDPSRQRQLEREADADTFGALAERYIEQHAKPKKRSWREDRRRLTKEIPRSWRKRPAGEITRREIRELIERKAVEAPIAGNRLRALLHKLFAFAIEREIVEHNPVTGTPRPGTERPRQRVLTDDEIRAFWQATEPGTGDEVMSAPMSAFWRLRLVTAQRAAEVNTMRWLDLDLANSVWTIPAERSKNSLAHRVPLSSLALDIIAELPRSDDYVLAGARGKRQQSEATKAIDLEDFHGHDLRRTAASGMASAGVPRLHIAKVLNHAERGVTAVYDRHGYDAEKRVALDTWARKLSAILERAEGAEVVPFARR